MNSCLVHEQFRSLWTATSHFSVQYTFRRRVLRTHQPDCTIYLGTSLYNLEFRVSSVRQGSTKWLYWLFKIMINIISHYIFFLKITAKSQNKYVFLTETYLCGTFQQIIFFVKETIKKCYHTKNNILSQKLKSCGTMQTERWWAEQKIMLTRPKKKVV